MDEKLVLGGIDVGNAGMHDGEMQTVGRDRAFEKLVRRSRP